MGFISGNSLRNRADDAAGDLKGKPAAPDHVNGRMVQIAPGRVTVHDRGKRKGRSGSAAGDGRTMVYKALVVGRICTSGQVCADAEAVLLGE